MFIQQYRMGKNHWNNNIGLFYEVFRIFIRNETIEGEFLCKTFLVFISQLVAQKWLMSDFVSHFFYHVNRTQHSCHKANKK